MKHLDTVASEFTRQADAFSRSETLSSAPITERISAALGERRYPRIVDVACGPGILAPVLAEKADQVIGIDFTRKQLRLAIERCREAGVSNAQWLRGVVEATPLASASVDAAILRLALHHFERPEDVLREVRRMLRPGGRLVVLDILTSADPRLARLHNSIERLRDPSHTAFNSGSDLSAMIARAGFDSNSEEIWATPRSFEDWASIIADPVRMDALEVVLRELARSGADAGIGLHEREEGLWFRYEWGLFIAHAAG